MSAIKRTPASTPRWRLDRETGNWTARHQGVVVTVQRFGAHGWSVRLKGDNATYWWEWAIDSLFETDAVAKDAAVAHVASMYPCLELERAAWDVNGYVTPEPTNEVITVGPLQRALRCDERAHCLAALREDFSKEDQVRICQIRPDQMRVQDFPERLSEERRREVVQVLLDSIEDLKAGTREGFTRIVNETTGRLPLAAEW